MHWFQVIALGGTAVSEVIQVGSSMYIATGWQSPQTWAILCGCCVMTPLTWIPDYKSLERLSMLAVVAIVFTASVVTVSGFTNHSAEYQRCAAAEFSMSKFFVGTSGEPARLAWQHASLLYGAVVLCYCTVLLSLLLFGAGVLC